MSNPFGGTSISAGYASARPPLHRTIVERFATHCGQVKRALDVGCGAGLSTRPLLDVAEQCVGLDPVTAMIRHARTSVPGANFAVGLAEALPVKEHSMCLLAAAGSLNYVQFDRFFAEAAKALRPGGLLAVYDFSPGREFDDSADLAEWFARFHHRYPTPPSSAHYLDPQVLAQVADGFVPVKSESFVIPLTLEREFYLRYMLTETNVAAAVAAGTPEEEIQDWCRGTLQEVFETNPRRVLFRGYWALLRAPREGSDAPRFGASPAKAL